MRNSSGFTMLEIIVVLILMGIIAAYVLGRSLGTDELDLTSQTDKIRLQLRYAQAEALKLADDEVPVWGMRGTSGKEGEFWLFRVRVISPGNFVEEEMRIPGADYRPGLNRVKTADLKVILNDFTLFFDRIGKPYTAYTDEAVNTPVAGTGFPVTVTAETGTRNIIITPETGLVR